MSSGLLCWYNDMLSDELSGFHHQMSGGTLVPGLLPPPLVSLCGIPMPVMEEQDSF